MHANAFISIRKEKEKISFFLKVWLVVIFSRETKKYIVINSFRIVKLVSANGI